ncbi:MAG: hypothetical protein QXS20_00175 [Candidatus Thorarchaeota archaeon]
MSRMLGVPYSTVKSNLRVLTELGLLTGGSMQRRGVPASLSPVAHALIGHMSSLDD